MPEMIAVVRWPDGREQQCYSPSLVLHDHLRAGTDYTVADFVHRSSSALDEASARVRAKYGFACTSAAETQAKIAESAMAFPPDAVVSVLAMNPPLERS